MHSIYDWFSKHRLAVDFVIAVVLWLMFTPFSLLPTEEVFGFGGNGVGLVFSTLLLGPLIWRSTRPVAAGIAIAMVALTQWSLDVTPMPSDVAVPLIVYALAAFGPRWASIGGLVLAMLGGVLLVSRFYLEVSVLTLADLPYGVVLLILVWVLVLFAWTAGDLTRTKRLREQALADRAHRLEIEAQQERKLAASDERAHIAREMHDIVAHSLSVIITQADGARYAASAHPEIAPATLATIAQTGRASLQEMRRLLGVLRGDDDASMRPLPGLNDLDELLLALRATGLVVSYDVKGEARRSLPTGAELTAYRCVQEGLTNVMKHAGPNVSAQVYLVWSSRGLEVSVQDNGRGASASLASTGPISKYDVGSSPSRNLSVAKGLSCAPETTGGNGLRGMAERVNLYGGTFVAKPLAGGGFGITATIPYSET